MLRALTVVFLLVMASSAGAATRYASPAGGGDCSQASPCGLATALSGAANSDTVVVGAGTYGSAASPLTLATVATAVDVQGAVIGAGRPVVFTHGLRLTNGAASVRDLEIRATDSFGLNLGAGASATRMLVRKLDTSEDDACVVSGILTNSVCSTPRTGNYSALSTQAGVSSALRNVTAVGAAYGVYVNSGSNTALLANSVLQGGDQQDLRVNVSVATADHSAYGTSGTSNGASIVDAGGNITQPAVFADAAAFDYRPAASSPTVDAGDANEVTGEYDLNGNLRTIGTAPDIGAYERVPAPAGSTDTPTAVGLAAAQLNGTIDPKGGRAYYHFEYGPTTGYGTATPAQALPATITSTAVSTVLSALPATATHYRLVATTDGGTVAGADQVVPGVPSATAGDVTNITATTATLNGTVDLEGAPTGDARFVYGPDLTDVQTVTADGPVSASLTGLAPDTTYQWKARVQTSRGIEESVVKTFTTLPLPPTATTGDATEITPTSARLAGVVDTKGVEGQVSILLDGAPIAEVTRPTGPYNVVATGLAPGSTHTYRIRAVTTGGTALGDERTFTTAAAPTSTPTPTPDDEPSLTLDVGKGRTAGQLLLDRTTITLFVRCGDVACTATATGVVKKGRRTFGRLRAPKRALSLGANEQGAVRLRSSKRLRAKVRAFLNRRPKAKVIMTLSGRFEGEDGSVIERTVRVRVRRLKR